MKALLDEGVPKRLARLLAERGHDVKPFPNRWKGLKNGKLLSVAKDEGFEALITCDKNLLYQQGDRSLSLAVLVLPDQDVTVLEAMIDVLSDARIRLPFRGLENRRRSRSAHPYTPWV
ncbi:DUF5615 family PIN-like protein [Jiella marina]|uniref:DUF5615 family PIN-like protein n=1 Tax=Jiella sp. LLJ827 TaxID=2917712 RepID=UPI002100F0BC|nr:DUF5615 family PIN-like protein [Jiella sp. LLJ827]MCQ0987251.1 DUF5615 family PIN-like protein [Jiella sp. LLJ827]